MMTLRCRASAEAIKRGLRRGVSRDGEFLGMTGRGEWAKVVWDGTVTVQLYHPDFIEIVADGGGGDTK